MVGLWKSISSVSNHPKVVNIPSKRLSLCDIEIKLLLATNWQPQVILQELSTLFRVNFQLEILNQVISVFSSVIMTETIITASSWPACFPIYEGPTRERQDCFTVRFLPSPSMVLKVKGIFTVKWCKQIYHNPRGLLSAQQTASITTYNAKEMPESTSAQNMTKFGLLGTLSMLWSPINSARLCWAKNKCVSWD